MNHHLFRHLNEKGHITKGSKLGIRHTVYEDLRATETIQGTFEVLSMYAHPMMPDTRIVVSDGTTTLDINKNDIKLVDEQLPSMLGASTGYVPFELTEDQIIAGIPDDGKRHRVRLTDELDDFQAKDHTPDNYVEERVNPDDFLVTTRKVHG